MLVESSTKNTCVLIVNHFFQQVDRDKAIIVLVLHYLKKKTLSDVILTKLKPVLLTFCFPCMKDSPKENLLSFLGRVLFGRKIVIRKDGRDVIHGL